MKATPTGDSLASLIDRLNPILTGWRNYYRYATWACRDFNKLDNWIWWRVGRWLRKKHRKAYWRQLRRRFTRNVRGERQRWVDGPSRLRLLREGGTSHFPHRGIRIPNGWNAEPDEQFRSGADPGLINSGRPSTPSAHSEGHLRRQPYAESRMLGNLHVRFGERDGETWLRKALKRFIPTLHLVLSPRPSRPRWRSARPGRPPTQPLTARSVSGGRRGRSFLPREEWGLAQGKKVRPRRCGQGGRGVSQPRPDQAMRGGDRSG